MVGLPDSDYGEAVCAVIVPEVDAKRQEEFKPAISLEELRTWAKDKLAPYKVLQSSLPSISYLALPLCIVIHENLVISPPMESNHSTGCSSK